MHWSSPRRANQINQSGLLGPIDFRKQPKSFGGLSAHTQRENLKRHLSEPAFITQRSFLPKWRAEDQDHQQVDGAPSGRKSDGEATRGCNPFPSCPFIMVMNYTIHASHTSHKVHLAPTPYHDKTHEQTTRWTNRLKIPPLRGGWGGKN